MNVMKWLLDGDVSIQYRVNKELLRNDNLMLKSLIPNEGYGKSFLEMRNDNGHFGLGFYQTKWISSHYTLLDLRNLSCPVTNDIMECINLIIKDSTATDGGINPHTGVGESDVCINGMCLNYMCHFNIEEEKLFSLVDLIINQQMLDGGYNCRVNRSGVKHSSLHTTISILEGISSYNINGYTYRLEELLRIQSDCIEFILKHKLFKSDKTDEIINKSFTMLSYPSRWKFDILRCLEYFVDANIKYDDRMSDAIEVLKSKRKKDGTWPVQAKHPGKVHFDMEKTGTSSRWNTLRALKVLKRYDHDNLLESVLNKINMNFKANKIQFGVGASLLLKAHGIINSVNDIDIIVDPNDVEKAKKVMDSLGLLEENEYNASYLTENFLSYNIDGIEIDIMSNMSVQTEDGIYTYVFDKDELTYKNVFTCKDLPLLSLEKWHVAYQKINRPKKVKMIEEYFNRSI